MVQNISGGDVLLICVGVLATFFVTSFVIAILFNDDGSEEK